jgi:uncharacterized membrane protein
VDWFLIVFRILHITSAIIWAGGTALFFFYLEPTITKLGPDAEKFVEEVVNKRKLPQYFAIFSSLTVLGGLFLYFRQAGGIQLWTTAGTESTVFTIGGIAGIIAWAIGGALIAPGVKKVGMVGAEIKAAGGPPTAELMTKLHAAQESLRMAGTVDIVLVGIAVLCMSTARYLP